MYNPNKRDDVRPTEISNIKRLNLKVTFKENQLIPNSSYFSFDSRNIFAHF